MDMSNIRGHNRPRARSFLDPTFQTVFLSSVRFGLKKLPEEKQTKRLSTKDVLNDSNMPLKDESVHNVLLKQCPSLKHIIQVAG